MAIDRRDFSAFNNQQIDQLMRTFGSGGKKDSEIETLTNKTITGNLTGNVTGDLAGNAVGTLLATLLKLTPVTYVADGAIPATVSWAILDANGATCDMTIAAPTAGAFLIISCLDASNSVTVTMTAGDFDGAGAGGDVATFNAAEDTLVLFGISASRWIIVANESVTLG